MDDFTFAIVMIVLLIYAIPSMVAVQTNHPYRHAIVALNLLLGWSFIGWVIALVWAIAQPRPVSQS